MRRQISFSISTVQMGPSFPLVLMAITFSLRPHNALRGSTTVTYGTLSVVLGGVVITAG